MLELNGAPEVCLQSQQWHKIWSLKLSPLLITTVVLPQRHSPLIEFSAMVESTGYRRNCQLELEYLGEDEVEVGRRNGLCIYTRANLRTSLKVICRSFVDIAQRFGEKRTALVVL